MISYLSHPQSLQRQLLLWIMMSLLCVAILAGGFAFLKTYHDFNDFQRNNLKNIAMLFASSPQKKNINKLLERRLYEQGYSSQQIDKLIHSRNNFRSKWNTRPKPALDINSTVNEQKMINRMAIDTHNLSQSNGDNQEEISQYNSKNDGEIRVHIIPLPLERLNPQQLQAINSHHLLDLPVGFGNLNSKNEGKSDDWQTYRIDQHRRIIIVRQKSSLQEKLAIAGALQAFLPMLIAMLILMGLLPFILNKMFQPVHDLSRQVANRDEQDLSAILLKNKNGQTQIPQELQPLVKEINQLLTRVSGYIFRQRRFIADASHELRSPLTAISLQVQRLQRMVSDSDSSLSNEQRIKSVQQGINKLAVRVTHNQHLVEQLLTLARIEAGQMQSTSTALMPVLTEAVMLLLPIADNKLIELEVDDQLENLNQHILTKQVKVDETSLLMLLKNLIQNAILYTPDSGLVKITILDTQSLQKIQENITNHEQKLVPIINHKKDTMKLDKYETRLVVQISDTGVGIPKNAYNEAFTPFVRFNQDNNPQSSFNTISDTVQQIQGTDGVKGTGLGLAIVYQICQQAEIDLYLSATNSETKNRGLTVSLVF